MNKSSKDGQSKKEPLPKSHKDMVELLTAKTDTYRIPEPDKEQEESTERCEKEGEQH